MPRLTATEHYLAGEELLATAGQPSPVVDHQLVMIYMLNAIAHFLAAIARDYVSADI